MTRQFICEVCTETFTARRPARTCGTRCRKRLQWRLEAERKALLLRHDEACLLVEDGQCDGWDALADVVWPSRLLLEVSLGASNGGGRQALDGWRAA
jgi:hypothetical protein